MPHVGCFGKLPLQSEFIRHNLTWREGRALDQWFQEGVVQAARSSDLASGDSNSVIHHGLFTGNGDQRSIAFSAIPSRDRNGRRYPFVVFEVRRETDRTDEAAASLDALDAFTEATTALMAAPWQSESLAEFLDDIDRLDGRPRAEGTAEPAAQATPDQLLTALYPNRDRVDALAHIDQCIAGLRAISEHRARRIGRGIRLPVGKASRAMAARWWLGLVESVLRRPGWQPCMIWPAEQRYSSRNEELLLFARQPPAQVAADLLGSLPSFEGAIEPSAMAGSGTIPDHIPADVTTIESLTDWLAKA
jgi:type VI secretion system protein ImpM